MNKMKKILEKAKMLYLFIKIHFLKYFYNFMKHFYKWLVNPFIDQEELYKYYQKQLHSITNNYDIIKINGFGIILRVPEGNVNMNLFLLKEKDIKNIIYEIIMNTRFNSYRYFSKNHNFVEYHTHSDLIDLLDNYFMLYAKRYEAYMEKFIVMVAYFLAYIPNVRSEYKTKDLYLNFILAYMISFDKFPEAEIEEMSNTEHQNA